MRRISADNLVAICLAVCLAILAVRLFDITVLHIVEQNGYWTHTRIDSILFGCILALWANPMVEERPAWSARGWHALLALVVIFATFAMKGALLREGIRYTLQGAALLVIFNYQLQGANALSRVLRWRILQRIGLWSYTLYLVHYAMLYAVRGIAPDATPVASAMAALILSCGYCAAMHTVVEQPLARVRRQLAYAN